MADFVMHHMMGNKTRSALPSLAQAAVMQYPACFYWGCQGPDPLFFRKITRGSPLHALGNTMHRENTSALFYVMANAVSWLGGKQHEMGLAYFFGFLCHYALDSEIHPYVYFHQTKQCERNPKLLAGAVHSEIEAQMDFAMYLRETSKMVTTFEPDDYYTLSPDEMGVIASLLHVVCRKVYKVDVPPAEFRHSVRQMLNWEQFFYSGSTVVYRGAKAVERVIGRGALLTGHMKVDMPTWDCLNQEGTPWVDLTNPVEERTESVPELLEMACIRAYTLAMRYAMQFACGEIEYRKFAYCFDRGNPNLR